jgi:hypothetical protein
MTIYWRKNEKRILFDRVGSVARMRECIVRIPRTDDDTAKKRLLYMALDELDVILFSGSDENCDQVKLFELAHTALTHLHALVDCGHSYPEKHDCITKEVAGNLLWAINLKEDLLEDHELRKSILSQVFESAADAESHLGNHVLAKENALYALRGALQVAKTMKKEQRAYFLYVTYVLVAYIYAASGDMGRALRIQKESSELRATFLARGENMGVASKVYVSELIKVLEGAACRSFAVSNSEEALAIVNSAIDATNYVRGWGMTTRRLRLLKVIALIKLDRHTEVRACFDDINWWIDDYFWRNLRNERDKDQVIEAISKEAKQEFGFDVS